MALRHLGVVAVSVGLFCGACGGSQKKAEEPKVAEPEAEEPSEEEVLIPEEKFGEINRAFERKTSMVSRCFVEALEAGEVKKNEKGFVTVGLTVLESGAPSKVRVLETSFKSKVIQDCVTGLVERWTFTTLPRPLEISHTYVLQQF